jgi:hypothetical protein
MRTVLVACAWLTGTLLFGQRGLIVSGAVEDESGTHIPNVVIALLTSESDAAERYVVHTDAGGLYGFADLKPGYYRLELQAPGFATATIRSIELSPLRKVAQLRTVLHPLPNGACLRDVYPREIRLLPVGSHRGSLAGFLRMTRPSSNRDRDRKKIQIVIRDGGRELTRIEAEKNTFRIPDLRSGKYTVQITGIGIYADIWDVTVREDLETEYEFPISPCRDRTCDPASRFKGDPILICQ